MMELRKEWFEPGPDGESPFEREYYNHRQSGTMAGNAISAAFRALLAVHEQAAPADAKDAKIAELRESLERTKLALNTTSEQRDKFWSQRDAARAEVERLQGELRYCNHMNRDLTTERDALQASLRDEQAKRASIEAELAACRESRDALRARIDAGVPICDSIAARRGGR